MFKPNLACGYLWSICWLSFKVLLLVPLGSIHFKINLKDGSHSILKHLSKQKLKFSYVFYNADIAQYIHNAFAFLKNISGYLFYLICTHILLNVFFNWGFPGSSMVANLLANGGDAGDAGSVPGLERSPEEGNGNPLQYSCLESPMDREACGLQSIELLSQT